MVGALSSGPFASAVQDSSPLVIVMPASESSTGSAFQSDSKSSIVSRAFCACALDSGADAGGFVRTRRSPLPHADRTSRMPMQTSWRMRIPGA